MKKEMKMEELTYDEIVAKLRRGEKLDEYEIRTIVWESHQVYEMEGEEHRWHREMFTVIDLDGELWGIDWMRGLTERVESEYLDQPYRVKRVEKVVTRTEVTYERV